MSSAASANGEPIERAPTTEGGSLKRRAATSTVWFVSAFVVNKAFKLVSSLVLTRLLAPEIFGLMAIVQSIRQGIVMFTDLGVRGKMIEDPRSNEPYFYNTVWTYAFIRSWALYLILCVIAYPASLVYDEPDLVWIIPVVCLALVITAFNTNVVGILNRNLEFKRTTIQQLAIQILTLVFTAVWAYFDPTIRAPVAGVIFAAIARLINSYTIVPGFRNRFYWDPEVMRSVVKFGRWVMVSTGARYLLTQGDRLLLGLLVVQSELGLYAVAVLLAEAGIDFVRNMSNGLLQIIYARLSDRGVKRLQHRMGQIRWILLGVTLPGMALIAIFGSHIVALLYDPRYAEAGWMLQVLAVAGGIEIILLTSTNAMLSRGDSFRFMIFQCSNGVVTIACIVVGYWLGDMFGVVVGRLISNFLAYPAAAWGLSSHKIWMPKQDLLATVGFVAMVVIGIEFVLPYVPMIGS